MKPLFNLTQIQQIIADAGPIMKLHPDERYRMDHPDPFLASGLNKLQWGIVQNTDSYDRFTQQVLGEQQIKNAASLMDAVAAAKNNPRAKDPSFEYWIHVADALKPGNQDRAKSLVCVRQRDESFVDLQFFFFYAFNGPGRFRATAGNLAAIFQDTDPVGRHYGDLEHITLRVAPASEGGRNWKVAAVYLSRHDQTRWVTDLKQLQWKDRHPIIYVAVNSHAHYENAGDHYYKRVYSYDFKLGTFAVDLMDRTGNGVEFDTSQRGKSEIVFSNVEEHGVQKPVWWDYDKRWGQYEKLKYTYKIDFPGIPIPINVYTFSEVGAGPGPISRFENDAETFERIVPSALNNLELFGIGRDKRLYHSFLDGDGWHPWESWYVGTDSVVDVAAVAGNNLEVFVVGADGVLYHNWLDGNGWHNWDNFAGPLRVRSVSGFRGPNRNVEVFAIGLDGALYHNFLNGGWHNWGNFAGSLRMQSVTQVAGNNLELFAVGNDSILYHNWLDGNGWHNWENFAGPLRVRSVSGFRGPNRNVEVFAVGLDGVLYHNFLNGGWHNWANFAGPLRVQSVTPVAGNNLEVFAVGNDSVLYHNWLDGNGWHNWENFAGPLRVRSVAAVRGPNRNVEAFAIGLDGTLYHNFLNGGWHQWEGPFTR